MNDTERIDELIEEIKDYNDMVDNSKTKEKTKQNILEYEEPVDDLEKTKVIIGGVSEENISNNNGKNNNKNNKNDEEDKKLNRTIIAIVVGVTVVSVLILTFLIVLAKNRSETITSNDSDILSKEEYKVIVKEYGDAVTKSVKDYMNDFNGKVPTFTDIKSSIYYPKYNITCIKSIINPDGSVYLDDCSVEGFNNRFNYSYGKLMISETESSDGKQVFIYKSIEDGGHRYYALNNKTKESNEYKLVDTYKCSEEDCLGYYGTTKNNKEVVIKDGKYYLYNPITKDKTELPGIFNEEYLSISLLARNDGTSYALYLVKPEGTGAFYNIARKCRVTESIYSENSTTSKLADSGYFAGVKRNKNNSSVSIIHQNTGEEVYKFDNSLEIRDTVIGGTNLYYLEHSRFGERTGCFLTTSFNKIIPDLDYYIYAINSDNTITVKNKDNNAFMRYDLTGKKIYESSLYTEVLKVLEDYVLVRTKKEVVILNRNGKVVTSFFKTKDSYKYHYTYSNIVTKDGKKGIYLVVEDTAVADGVAGRGLEYYYLLDTKEIGVNKLITIGAHD